MEVIQGIEEHAMERLISLFREADYEQWSPSNPHPPPREHEEPLYFQELLEYLRDERSKRRNERKELIGAKN
jgi:hypothetical protein